MRDFHNGGTDLAGGVSATNSHVEFDTVKNINGGVPPVLCQNSTVIGKLIADAMIDYNGGGLVMNAGRAVIDRIANCSVTNAQEGWGGGFYCGSAASIVKVGTIESCSAYAGGGFNVDGQNTHIEVDSIINCTADLGSAFFLASEHNHVKVGLISGCVASGTTGEGTVYLGTNLHNTIILGSFHNNTATTYNGIFVDGGRCDESKIIADMNSHVSVGVAILATPATGYVSKSRSFNVEYTPNSERLTHVLLRISLGALTSGNVAAGLASAVRVKDASGGNDIAETSNVSESNGVNKLSTLSFYVQPGGKYYISDDGDIVSTITGTREMTIG